MERIPDAIREASNRLRGLRESEVPYPAGYDSAIDPNQGINEGDFTHSTFPEVRGRRKPLGNVAESVREVG